MAERRHLKHAPIREAVIDFRIEPRLDIESIRTLGASLKEDFQESSDIRLSVFGMETGHEGTVKTSSVDHGAVGIRLTTADGKYVLQLKVDGFTFSRLPPYENWDNFSSKAKKYWQQYIALVGDMSVTRVATRFINVMEIPLPILDFKEYLTEPPEVPSRLPQELAGFFSRLAIVNRELDAVAAVTLALEDFSREQAPIVLDIDVFKNMNEQAENPDVWAVLEALRNFKNDIFFESITEKTARQFE